MTVRFTPQDREAVKSYVTAHGTPSAHPQKTIDDATAKLQTAVQKIVNEVRTTTVGQSGLTKIKLKSIELEGQEELISLLTTVLKKYNLDFSASVHGYRNNDLLLARNHIPSHHPVFLHEPTVSTQLPNPLLNATAYKPTDPLALARQELEKVKTGKGCNFRIEIEPVKKAASSSSEPLPEVKVFHFDKQKLARYSEYFENMFSATVEKTGSLSLSNVSPVTVAQVQEFLYTHTLKNPASLGELIELSEFAQKYAMPDLLEWVSEQLMNLPDDAQFKSEAAQNLIDIAFRNNSYTLLEPLFMKFSPYSGENFINNNSYTLLEPLFMKFSPEYGAMITAKLSEKNFEKVNEVSMLYPSVQELLAVWRSQHPPVAAAPAPASASASA